MTIKTQDVRKYSTAYGESILNLISAPTIVFDAEAHPAFWNDAWERFATAKLPDWPDSGKPTPYRDICEALECLTVSEKESAVRGIGTVIEGQCDVFRMEYGSDGTGARQLCAVSLSEEGEVALALGEIPGLGEGVADGENAAEDDQAEPGAPGGDETEQVDAAMMLGYAHGFSNSLSNIRGYARLLLERPEDLEDPDTARRYVRRIEQASDEAVERVQHMRKLFGDRETQDSEGLDINSLVGNAVEQSSPRWHAVAQAEGVDVRIEKQLGSVPRVKGRASQLEGMLTSMICASVSCMETDGQVCLKTWEQAGEVVLEVSNTALWCPEASFMMGMEGAVKEFGGRVCMKKTNESGKTIRIAFCPTGTAEAADDAGEAEDDAPAGPVNCSILVVEDDAAQRELLAEYLQGDGHSVETARDGAEGAEMFDRNTYDLVITDRAMPRLNGIELTREVKQSASGVPVILLTGFGATLGKAEADEAGVDIILPKPIDPDGLQDAVCTALRSGTLSAGPAGGPGNRTVGTGNMPVRHS